MRLILSCLLIGLSLQALAEKQTGKLYPCQVEPDGYQDIISFGSNEFLPHGGVLFTRKWMIRRCANKKLIVLDSYSTRYNCLRPVSDLGSGPVPNHCIVINESN